ncbi:MAG: hypothetical protein WAS05_07960 [Candidatus Nanopelagicales bacterium]
MSFIFNIVLVLHFLGLASLIGGFLVQIKTKPREVNTAMFHGVLTQIVTGIIMVGLMYPLHASDPTSPLPNNLKIAIKLSVAVVVLIIILANRKKKSISDGTWAAIGGLSILDVIVAVFV